MPKILILCLAHHTHNKDIQKNEHTQRHMDTDIVPFSHFALFVSYLYAKDTNFVWHTTNITHAQIHKHMHTHMQRHQHIQIHTKCTCRHTHTYPYLFTYTKTHMHTVVHVGSLKKLLLQIHFLSQIWQKLLL